MSSIFYNPEIFNNYSALDLIAMPISTMQQPELLLYFSHVKFTSISLFGLKLDLSANVNVAVEYIATPAHIVFKAITFSYLILMSICLLMPTAYLAQKDSALNIEYNTVTLFAECEKELFSVEDLLYLFLLFGFLVLSYFGFLFLFMSVEYSEILFLLFAAPIIVFSLILIPLNLIFDFGLTFIMYLRGASTSSSICLELIYDYIGVIAFFTRLIVQFIRIILMFIVFFMMHKAVIHFYFPERVFMFSSQTFSSIVQTENTHINYIFLLCMFILVKVGYWCFELMHALFILIVQFLAFFVIVF